MDTKFISSPEGYLNQTYKFLIKKLDKFNIIVSRRELVQKLEREKINLLLNRKNPDLILPGTVTRIEKFGAFVDIGGIDGLLHISEIGYGRIDHPSEVLHVGDIVRVKILKIDNPDSEKPKISLSAKAVLQDPWETIQDRYSVGSIVSGKVLNLAEYGAFIELEKGIEGLLHVSELHWVKRIKHPSDVLKVGEAVEVKIIALDTLKKKISLSLRAVGENPWDMAEKKYLSGGVHEGKIQKINKNGVFVELEEGIVGLLPAFIVEKATSKKAHSLFKANDVIKVVVSQFDRENQRIALVLPEDKDVQTQQEVAKFLAQTTVSSFGTFGEMVKDAGSPESSKNKKT
jgi:small subunit ribosomal protein S1